MLVNAIMNTGNYELSTGEGAYEALLISQDLSSNKEMIIFGDYSNELGRKHGAVPGLIGQPACHAT